MNLFDTVFSKIASINIGVSTQTILSDMKLLTIIVATAALIILVITFLLVRKCKKQHVRIFADSALGDRNKQQDYGLFSKSENLGKFESIGSLAVLCDGMGGLEGGEIASRICAEAFFKGVYQVGYTDDVATLFKDLANAADEEVFELKNSDGKKMKSGSTLVAVLLRGNKAFWVSVGDSRIYVYSKKRLKKLTREHNHDLHLTEMLKAGSLSLEEYNSASQKGALISYIGKGGDLIIDTGELKIPRKSLFLLCSDGLYNSLDSNTIQKLIRKNLKKPQDLPYILTKAAIESGKCEIQDNTSAVIMTNY